MKSAQLLFFAFIFSLISSNAQTTRRDLLQKFSSEKVAASLIPKDQWRPFPKTPAEWQAKFPDSTLQKFISIGEEALKEEFKSIPATVALEFVTTGNRRNYQNLANIKRKLLWDLAIAESIEGKGRFVPNMLNGIWSICEETFWGATAHLGMQKVGKGLPDASDPIVELFAAETAATLAWVDYFAGSSLEKISPLVRPRIRYETERRIFTPLLTAQYFYLGRGDSNAKLNNWTPWIMSNYIAADLLLQENEEKRVSGLMFAMKYIDQYINGLGEDGGCDEGPGYWSGASGTTFDALCLLESATGGKVNIYKEPFIKKMASYIYKTHISGEYFINVADAAPRLRPSGAMLFRFGRSTGDSTMMSFGSMAYHKFSGGSFGFPQYNRSRSLFDLLALKDVDLYPSAYEDPQDVWFSDVELMAARSKKGLFLASHGGHNGESHNHNDVGDFIVYADGFPVIVDAGAGNYTARTFSDQRYTLWFNSSAFHNLPVINGSEQSAGEKFSATAVKYNANKKNSSLVMDIAAAYPSEAGIRSWIRKVSLDKKGSIEIKDQYSANGPLKTISQTFMTVCATDIGQKGKIIFLLPDNGKVFLDYDANAWEVKREKIELTQPEDVNFKSNWDGKDIWRILLVGKKQNASGVFVYTVHK